MHVRSVLAAAGLCGSLVLAALPASAAPPLRFSGPGQVTNGLAFNVSSTDPCPAPPASAGTDPILVEVALPLPNGEGGVNTVAPLPDGNWSTSLTATWTSTVKRGKVTAVCAVFDGTTGSATTYATYKDLRVTLTS